jgi:hypothetical protein
MTKSAPQLMPNRTGVEIDDADLPASGSSGEIAPDHACRAGNGVPEAMLANIAPAATAIHRPHDRGTETIRAIQVVTVNTIDCRATPCRSMPNANRTQPRAALGGKRAISQWRFRKGSLRVAETHPQG